MAGESEAAAAVSGGELPVKRQREDGQNGESVSVEMEDANNNNNNAAAGDKEEQCFSSVIPGWFSEISPMWPGQFSKPLIICVCLFVFYVLCSSLLGCLCM